MHDESQNVITAQELRLLVLKKQFAAAQEHEREETAHEKALKRFAESFLTEHVSEAEREVIRKLVMNAVANCKFEALVYSFPSDLCTDSGRAINNRLDHWPETLQGKARELYDRYVEVAKPKGFLLKATIINFPNGMPGDVGFYLSWAPETPA